MAKLRSGKKNKNKRQKTTGYYIKVYFLTFVIIALIIIGENFIFQPKPPCANSGSCRTDLTENIDNNAIGTFGGRKVVPPKIDLASIKNQTAVLGTRDPDVNKHVYVDLAAQIIYAYEGTTKVFQTYTSTGRWNKTPVGNFHIWSKLRATRMSGGQGDDAYDLPNVPFVMYFYHDFGLHGAYWHDNFGHTMSHGCVNLRQIDAEFFYNWADGPTKDHPGTAVSICNTFTGPDNCVQENPVN